MNGPAKLQPAFLAGLAIGVLSALPVINLGNLCCCAWVLFGGALAAYLMQQNHPAPITTGDGAMVGLLAGLLGGIITTLLSIPITLALGPFQARMVERVLESARDMPPEARSILEGMRGGPAMGIGIIVSFITLTFVGAFFGMIGGLIGAVVFRRNAPPPPAPPLPPSPPVVPPPPLPPDVPGTV
jgi:hypothetical protein